MKLQASVPLRPDCGLIVYGSLARLEMTGGSDVDWSLLVDGQTDGDDTFAARRVSELIAQLSKDLSIEPPTAGGPFGDHSFSHELVHKVGGDGDTNANTTRRILLLLESASLANDEVRGRVVLAVLNRYLKQDSFFPRRPGRPNYRVPRFLLNDLV